MTRPLLRYVTAAALTAGMLASCSGAPRKTSLRHANVLLITLDTTRADHIGCYGYAAARTPNLDALAHDGSLFESCITTTAYTLHAPVSVLSGLYQPTYSVLCE